MAGQVVDVARAVTGIDDPATVVTTIQMDPGKAAEFQLAMGAQQAEFERMYLGDTRSARARDVELAKAGIKNHRANVLAGAALLLVIVCMLVVVWGSDMNEYGKLTLSLVRGRALGWVDQLFSFEFGTTRASKAKDDTISKLSGGVMDFHLAVPDGDIYVFSMDDRRNVRFRPDRLDAYAAKAPHEIQGAADQAALQEMQDRATDPDVKAQLGLV